MAIDLSTRADSDPVGPDVKALAVFANGLETNLANKADTSAVAGMAPVQSVNGATGAVVLDIPEGLGFLVAASNATDYEKARATVVCDGTADQVEINAALAANPNVVLSSGDFNLSATVESTLSNRKLSGAGIGATRLNLATTLVTGIHFNGTRTKVGTFPVSANVAEGAYTLTTGSDLSATLPAGTLIVLHSATEAFNTKRGYYYKGEWNKVRRITATTITLEHQTHDSYLSAALEIYKITPITNIELSDFGIYSTDASTVRHTGAAIEYGDNCIYRRVEVKGRAMYHGLKMEMVVGPLWDECRAIDCYDHNRNEINGDFAEGYGFIAEGCDRATMRKCYGLRNRHTFEDNSHTLHPVSRYLLFDDCVAEHDYSAGFSSHGNSEYQSAINCIAIGCGGGFVFRGRYTTLRDVRVLGLHSDPDPTYYDAAHPHFNNATAYESYDRAVWLGETVQQGGTGTNYQGIAGTGLVIDGLFVEVTGITRTEPAVSGRTSAVIESYEPLIDASIKNVSARGHTGDGINLQGQFNESVRIEDADFDCTNQFSASRVIRIIPTGVTTGVAAGFRSQDITIIRVRSKKAKNAMILIAGGFSTAASDLTERVLIEECVNLAQGTTARAIVEFPSGSFSMVELFRCRTPDLAVASIATKTVTPASSYKWMNKGSAAAVDVVTPAAL